MARPLRLEYEGAVYHLTSRGNARQDIFLVDPDRDLFLTVLGDTVKRFGWICHAYCLMTNHYHLLVETPGANLSRGMQHVNGVYTQGFNRRHLRTGHVLQGRFKAIVVEKESHLLELARYVVLNPVRAGTVRSAKNWPWSSYRPTAGLAEAPPLLTTDWILEQFHRDRKRASQLYGQFVRQGRDVNAWAELRGGILLGGDDFVAELKPLLSDFEAVRSLPRRERLATRPSLVELFSNVRSKEVRNRQIHAATHIHEYTLKEVGDFAGLRPSTVSMIATRFAKGVDQKGKL